MNEADKKLLKIYYIGWNDCPDCNIRIHEYQSPLEKNAYQLGWDHYILGDDVGSFDLLTETEILKMIKNDR